MNDDALTIYDVERGILTGEILERENEPFLILTAEAAERSLDMYLAATEPTEDKCHSTN